MYTSIFNCNNCNCNTSGHDQRFLLYQAIQRHYVRIGYYKYIS